MISLTLTPDTITLSSTKCYCKIANSLIIKRFIDNFSRILKLTNNRCRYSYFFDCAFDWCSCSGMLERKLKKAESDGKDTASLLQQKLDTATEDLKKKEKLVKRCFGFSNTERRIECFTLKRHWSVGRAVTRSSLEREV